jgi:hypothetical protein
MALGLVFVPSQESLGLIRQKMEALDRRRDPRKRAVRLMEMQGRGKSRDQSYATLLERLKMVKKLLVGMEVIERQRDLVGQVLNVGKLWSKVRELLERMEGEVSLRGQAILESKQKADEQAGRCEEQEGWCWHRPLSAWAVAEGRWLGREEE